MLLFFVMPSKPAVDIICRAGHVIGVVLSQEDGYARHVARLPQSPQRNLGEQSAEFLRIVQEFRIDRRFNRARRDVVDVDTDHSRSICSRKRLFSVSSFSIRSCNGAIRIWISSDVYLGVMCCEQFQSNASTRRIIARSTRA